MPPSSSVIALPFGVRPIRFAGGWSGHVLVDSVLVASQCPEASSSARVDAWRSVLERLVQGAEDAPGRTIMKRSPRAYVFRTQVTLTSDTIEIVCKRTTPRGVRALLLRWFGISQASRNWRRGFRVLRGVVSTVMPLAYLHRRSRPPQAWLITRFVPGLVDLERALTGAARELPTLHGRLLTILLIDEVIGLLLYLQTRGLHHRDFKASNVLVRDWNGLPPDISLWLVDLDGIVPRRFGADPWRMVTRLAASLLDRGALRRTDALRFLRRCPDFTRMAPESWKTRWRKIAADAARYNARSRRRKRGKIDGFEGL